MNIEELKLVMDTVKGVTDGAVTLAVLYLLLNSLAPLLKYSIVGVIIFKVVKLLTDTFKLEKVND